MLKHSDSFERSGRVDPDEELLGNGESESGEEGKLRNQYVSNSLSGKD